MLLLFLFLFFFVFFFFVQLLIITTKGQFRVLLIMGELFLKYVVCFRTNFRGTFNEYLGENSETVPDTFAGCVAVFCNPSTYFSESKSLCINLC